jgi:hypothetical protein
MFLARFIAMFVAVLVAGSLQAQDRSPPSLANFLIAVSQGDARMVASLLDNGFPVDARNAQGETPLLVAVQRGQTGVAQLLIERGASINAQAANMDTPWLLAGARGRTDMLKAMLPKGPDYSLRNRFGGSALIPACHYGHPETVRFLTSESKIDVDHVNNLGWTCLLEAVILGDGGPVHQEIIRTVLAAGAKPNIADRDGVTPLAHARRRGQTEVARIIAAAGGK